MAESPSAPPPSKPEPALVVALGDVRDGVAVIEAFAQALASRRVGPRALSAAVPALAGGCAPLREALEALEAALEPQLARDPDARGAVKAMLEHAATRVTELERELEGRDRTPIDARERLALEAVVRRAAGELDAIVRLTDLVVTAASPQSTWIDLGEVLAERRAPRPAPAPVIAQVELPSPIVVVHDPRLLLELFEFAVATVVRAGVKEPLIVASRDGGALSITVGAAPPGGPPRPAEPQTGPNPGPARPGPKGKDKRPPAPARVLHVVLRPEIPREADVVRAAARRAGFDLAIAPDGRTVTLSQLAGSG